MTALSERGKITRAKFSLPQDRAAFLVLNIHDEERAHNFVVRPRDTFYIAISNQQPDHIVALVEEQHAHAEKNGERLSLILIPADHELAEGQQVHVVGAFHGVNDHHVYAHLRNILAVHADEQGLTDGVLRSVRGHAPLLDQSMFDAPVAEDPLALFMTQFGQNSAASSASQFNYMVK